MKAQSRVRSIKETPSLTKIVITIVNGVPNLPPSTSTKTGGQIMWTCNPDEAGTLTLSFDPFHTIFAQGTASDSCPTLQFGPYIVLVEPPRPGSDPKDFHYHIGWTDSQGNYRGIDPVIIVDPTNNMP
ncbi:MAG TPA: hypothetical protein VH724_13090 [Candidatus Angelobacter sp.]|jgi:hypothetical protein|nr:hypothetical protein [Candidatus Angelobacter sp.]